MILSDIAARLLRNSTFNVPVREPSFAVLALGLMDANTGDYAFYAKNGVLYDVNNVPVLSLGAGGFGYATGAGGSVTQSTSKSTGVTLNKLSGQITLNNASLGAGAEAAFTLTNSKIAANDVVVVAIKSGGTSGAYLAGVTATGSGSCEITLTNLTAGSLGEAVVLNFAVIKAVNS